MIPCRTYSPRDVNWVALFAGSLVGAKWSRVFGLPGSQHSIQGAHAPESSGLPGGGLHRLSLPNSSKSQYLVGVLTQSTDSHHCQYSQTSTT